MAPTKSDAKTLEDVLTLLNSAALEPTKGHAARVSAIHRVARFLHRPPVDIPAEVSVLRRLLENLHPAQCGVTSKSLSNLKSELASALKTVGFIPTEESNVELTAEWLGFLDTAVADQQRWGVMRFAKYCCGRHINPEDVTQEIFEAYRRHLNGRLLTQDPTVHCKSTANTWNHLAKSFDLTLVRLEWGQKEQYRARPLSEYPVCLQKEIERYLSLLAHADIFDEAGPDKPLRPTSIRNVKVHLAQYFDALVNTGADPTSFTSLQAVVSANQMKTAFRAIQQRRGTNAMPSGVANIAASLTAIARHHLKLGEVEMKEILAVKKRVATDPRGLSAKNADRLGQFSDYKNVVLLVTLPNILMERADENSVGRKTALSAMHAAAMAILLSCPMRAKNLASLDLERHLRPRLHGTRTIYGIRIEGSEVKNGEPVEVNLNSKMSRLLHRYIMQYRSQISEANTTSLFPRACDGKPRDPGNFSKELTSRIRKETGLTVHAHLFRHIAAMLYLRQCPGDFETVRRTLKHKRLQTTMDFYAPLSNSWAHEQYDKVVLSKFGGSDD